MTFQKLFYLIILVVKFLEGTSSAEESDGSMLFTVISLVESDNPFTVQVCTRDSVPVSAQGLLQMYIHKMCTNILVINISLMLHILLT